MISTDKYFTPDEPLSPCTPPSSPSQLTFWKDSIFLPTFLPKELLAHSFGRFHFREHRQNSKTAVGEANGRLGWGYGSVVEHRHIQALGSSPNTTETNPRGHKVRSTALTTGLPSGTAGLQSQNLFQKDSQRVRGKQ